MFDSYLSRVKTYSRFVGPGFMIAVGYIDPGNWATDIAAGSQFGYALIFVILVSNLLAIFLQSLSLKLGITTNLDLAQACRKHFNRPVSIFLYIGAEIGIMACDLAEIIGTAIALNLLFNLPLIYGVLITSLDVFILIIFWEAKRRRWFEVFITALVLTVFGCFGAIVVLSKPDWAQVGLGFIPTRAFLEPSRLYIAAGILGATVMPHNCLYHYLFNILSPVYLHSSLVKKQAPQYAEKDAQFIENCDEECDVASQQAWLNTDPNAKIDDMRKAIKYSTIDTTCCLTLAFFVNAAILVVSAANFYTRNLANVADIKDAWRLLTQFLGPAVGFLFAIALLCSGQSSTITGTIAGQVVMEGFLGSGFKLPPWARRLVTRLVAIVPAIIIAAIKGDQGINDLLLLSQVILSIQLPFAVWPLIYFTSKRELMDRTVVHPEGSATTHSFANGKFTVFVGVLCALMITGLNIFLIVQLILGI